VGRRRLHNNKASFYEVERMGKREIYSKFWWGKTEGKKSFVRSMWEWRDKR
jgi:hypothetical protein